MIRFATVAMLLLGCGEHRSPDSPDAPSPDDTSPARETIAAAQNLEPGELVEGIMTGGRPDHAVIRLAAPMQLDWNIHSHVTGHAVTVYEEYDQSMVDHVFVPPGNGDWYLMIKNSGNVTADIQVSVGLYGDMTWRWQ